MDELQELLEQRDRLKARMSEIRSDLKAGTGSKSTLNAKLGSYRDSLKDINEQIRHLAPGTVKQEAPKRTQRTVGSYQYDFFERNNVVWGDLEGRTWSQVEGYTSLPDSMLHGKVDELRQWLAEGSVMLTERQRQFLDAYYNDGLSQEAIAERFGVDRSTVSRVMGRGADKLKRWAEGRRLQKQCAGPDGSFDWLRFLQEAPMLTDRQRQLLLILLSGKVRFQADVAEKLEIDRSTVTKTLQCATARLKRIDAKGTAVRRTVLEWDNANKLSLALETGMSLGFYYRYCFRGERYNGLTRYRYELARRFQSGRSAEQVSAEMGVPLRAAKFQRSQLRRVELTERPTPGSTIGENLDAETYLKLQRMVTGRC